MSFGIEASAIHISCKPVPKRPLVCSKLAASVTTIGFKGALVRRSNNLGSARARDHSRKRLAIPFTLSESIS
jgi:hypothetical protein